MLKTLENKYANSVGVSTERRGLAENKEEQNTSEAEKKAEISPSYCCGTAFIYDFHGRQLPYLAHDDNRIVVCEAARKTWIKEKD